MTPEEQEQFKVNVQGIIDFIFKEIRKQLSDVRGGEKTTQNFESFEDGKHETERLKAEIKRLREQDLRRLITISKLFFWIYTSFGLKNNIKKWLLAITLKKSDPLNETANLLAAVVNRLAFGGIIRLLIAMITPIILLVQIYQFEKQNSLLSQQINQQIEADILTRRAGLLKAIYDPRCKPKDEEITNQKEKIVVKEDTCPVARDTLEGRLRIESVISFSSFEKYRLKLIFVPDKGCQRSDLEVPIAPDNHKNPELVDINSTILRSGFFNNADLSCTEFSNTELDWAKFENSNLAGSNFTAANLKYANLKNANLSKAKFHEADLENADLQSANLSGVIDFETANLKNADLRGAKGLNCDNLPSDKEVLAFIYRDEELKCGASIPYKRYGFLFDF
ncbi:MAG: pentapeptide repeat-containing protein [Alphaproteobacteria bacterium]|nr:pentapeptide repeat-containing protein [Alphaproteobacteria bacterium]